MITVSQFYFVNISANKAWIFTKFYVVVNDCIVSLSFKLYDNLCLNARTRMVIVGAYDLSQVRAFTPRARAFMQGS